MPAIRPIEASKNVVCDGRMWRMMEPWIRSGDDSRLKGSLRTAAEDLRAYGRVAGEPGTAIPVA